MNLLPKEAINDRNSLEAILKEMHAAYEKELTPMSEEQTRSSVGVMLASNEQIESTYKDLCNHWQFRGFFKRCDVLEIKYEKRLLMWLAITNIDFGIAGMILVAYYVQYWVKKIRYQDINDRVWKDAPLTLEEVTNDCFPMGIFEKQTVHKFWDKQKIACPYPDNLIDYPTAALSFMKSENLEPISFDHESHR